MINPAMAGSDPSELSTSSDSAAGSVYIRCDGFPPHRPAGEVAAHIFLIMATAGLAGPGERADANKRLTGLDGVSACDAALGQETDPIRKVQSTLARAIHHIQAKEYDAALSDASAAPALAGESANDLGFRPSLMLSALELQAAALVRLSRPAEAETTALKMAASSPYDLIAQQRAARYTGLTADLTPEKKEFLERFDRILPQGPIWDATAHEWVGDYLVCN